MTAEQILYLGVGIAAVAIVCAIVAAIVLRCSKLRLNRKLDAEYGKRRH